MDPVVSYGLAIYKDRPAQMVFALVSPDEEKIPVTGIVYLKFSGGNTIPSFFNQARRKNKDDVLTSLSRLSEHVVDGELFVTSALVMIVVRSAHPWCTLKTEEEIAQATAEIRVVLAQILPPRAEFVFERNAHGLAQIGFMFST